MPRHWRGVLVIDRQRSVVVRTSFRPDFDLFRPFEMEVLLCATDALQARVMAAGCLGVGFRAFGRMSNVPWWLSDEDGKRIIDPNWFVTEPGTPAAVLLERPDLIPRGDIH